MSIVTTFGRGVDLAVLKYGNNPFVAWDNLAATATLGGTSVLTGGAASNAVNGNTYSYWLPNVTGSTATLTMTFASAISPTIAILAAHNLADLDASVTLERSSDGSTWVSADMGGTVTPENNSPIALRLSALLTPVRYWRFVFSGLSASDPLAVGVAFIGSELIIPRRFYQGFAPIITPTEVNLQSAVSVGGNYLSSSVIKRGSTMQASVSNVDPAFLRGASWKAFQKAFNDGKPAFFAWRPTKYPEDIHYIWRDGATIRPTNTGPRDLMGIDLQARVYEG